MPPNINEIHLSEQLRADVNNLQDNLGVLMDDVSYMKLRVDMVYDSMRGNLSEIIKNRKYIKNNVGNISSKSDK